MRFNDRLETLMGQSVADDSAKASLWMQIADVMAQEGEGLSSERAKAGLQRLREWRDEVPQERRRAASAALSFHRLSPELVDLFACDVAQVAAPMLARAQLIDEQWMRLIPRWPSTSRALLRERRDLPSGTLRLLSAYGSNDFALPSDLGEGVAVVTPIQIRDLVARIEAYRRDHSLLTAEQSAPSTAQGFRFESGGDGIINWVEGAPRGPLIGISLSEMAEPGGCGVDGHAAGACRQRMQFQDAHLLVAGTGESSGAWLISARPIFNSQDGRFQGYRGIAKRPEAAASPTQQLLGGGLSADSIRQLAHELRTPLNAIRGFGELIEGRFFGPVSQFYGELAHKIVKDASRLMTVIDDLDSAARLQTGAWAEDVHAQQTCDMAKVLTAVTEDLRKMGHSQSIELRVAIARDVPLAHIPEAAATRLVGRLLAAVVSITEEQEELSASLEKTLTGIAFRLSRPRILSGVSREQILATASVSDNGSSDALPLGLGFTFRLIDAMAHASGAYLEIGSELFSLVMPGHGQGAGESKESG